MWVFTIAILRVRSSILNLSLGAYTKFAGFPRISREPLVFRVYVRVDRLFLGLLEKVGCLACTGFRVLGQFRGPNSHLDFYFSWESSCESPSGTLGRHDSSSEAEPDLNPNLKASVEDRLHAFLLLSGFRVRCFLFLLCFLLLSHLTKMSQAWLSLLLIFLFSAGLLPCYHKSGDRHCHDQEYYCCLGSCCHCCSELWCVVSQPMHRCRHCWPPFRSREPKAAHCPYLHNRW